MILQNLLDLSLKKSGEIMLFDLINLARDYLENIYVKYLIGQKNS